MDQPRGGSREPDPGELAALFVEDRPGVMELQILTEPEIAEVVRQLQMRLRTRVAPAPRACTRRGGPTRSTCSMTRSASGISRPRNRPHGGAAEEATDDRRWISRVTE